MIEEKIKCAVKWIDGLAETQEKQGKGQLGNSEWGFCCLGFGCHLFDIDYSDIAAFNCNFTDLVGLKDNFGTFEEGRKYMDQPGLTGLNDSVHLGFKGISDFLKESPEWAFIPEVAEGVRQHYLNI